MNTYDTFVTPADWKCAHCKRTRGEHACLHGFTRESVQFAVMLRIKNEERWIAEVLESVLPLTRYVYVMDDHSTDETPFIVARYANQGVVLCPSPFSGLNESRDKNWLYDQILADVNPAWILCVDGDEVLEASGPDIIREYTETADLQSQFARDPVTSFKLQIAFMWNDREMVRVDRIYRDFWRPSLFKPFVPDPEKPDDLKLVREFRFKSTPWGRHVSGDEPNLHCSSVPQRRIHGAKLCPARLKHYGYMWRDDRVRKLDYYNSIDWKNAAEDCYRHVAQGDGAQLHEMPGVQRLLDRGDLSMADVAQLVDVPADARLVHAGPVEIVKWNESEPWQMTEWAKGQNA